MPVYVQHQTLARISDVFSPDAIWQAPGLSLFSRRPLLRDLLERAPREQRGQAAIRCFSHVTLALPQEQVDDDRHLTRGARARDLAEGLAALHRQDFGDILQGDEVRYRVVGDENLGPDEVDVRFGHALYLPAPGEQVRYTVSVSRDSAVWKTVCPVYPGQRLTLIGRDERAATHAAPDWPFAAEGAILLINDDLDAPPEVQVRPKDAFECSWDQDGGYYAIRARHGGAEAGGSAPRLLLRIMPAHTAVGAGPALARSAPSATAAPATRPAVWKNRQPQAGDPTALPLTVRGGPAPAGGEGDATYAPLAQPRVALAALALPRLSRYRETGAQALEIGLNHALLPCAPGADAVLGFAITHDDALYAVGGAGREPVTAPASFSPLDGARIELLAPAPELAERYLALLRLPQSPALPVAPGTRFLFGRGAPALAALRVLDSPSFLRSANGACRSSADRLGLSRSAFCFESGPDGCRIVRSSATQALYHLDQQLRFVAAIGEATPERPYLIAPGHHLVAGHYVLRFEA